MVERTRRERRFCVFESRWFEAVGIVGSKVRTIILPVAPLLWGEVNVLLLAKEGRKAVSLDSRGVGRIGDGSVSKWIRSWFVSAVIDPFPGSGYPSACFKCPCQSGSPIGWWNSATEKRLGSNVLLVSEGVCVLPFDDDGSFYRYSSKESPSL